MSNIRPFNFLEFYYSIGYTKKCSEMVFFSGDTFKDFIRMSLPTGAINVVIKNKQGTIIRTLIPGEFSYTSNKLTLNFTFSTPSQSITENYFEVILDGVVFLVSDYFKITRDSDYLKKTKLVKYAFNSYPNDYTEIRLPIILTKAKPIDNGSRFLTSDDELVRPVIKTQTEYDIFVNFKDYQSFQRKLYNSFLQRYFRIELDNGFFGQIIFENEFDVNWLDRVNNKSKTTSVVAKIKINNTQITEQDNLSSLEILPQPYANAECFFISESDNGTYTTRVYRIITDLPLLELQNVNWQLLPIGSTPALPEYFFDDELPSGQVTFNQHQMNATFSIVIKSTHNDIIENTDYKIQCTDTDLIKFNLNTDDVVILLSTSSLDFGDVAVGLSKKLSFTIQNIGTQDLLVTSINLPFGAMAYEADWQSGVIQAGQTKTVVITFTPIATVDYDGVITIISNADAGISEINIAGSGKLFDALKYLEENIVLVADTTKTINHNLNKSTVIVEVWDVTANPDEKVDVYVSKLNNNSLEVISDINRTVNIIVVG